MRLFECKDHRRRLQSRDQTRTNIRTSQQLHHLATFSTRHCNVYSMVCFTPNDGINNYINLSPHSGCHQTLLYNSKRHILPKWSLRPQCKYSYYCYEHALPLCYITSARDRLVVVWFLNLILTVLFKRVGGG